MKIEINLYATLSRYASDVSRLQDGIIKVKDHISVRELLKSLNIPVESVKLIFINGVHGKLDAMLKDGDQLGLFPAIGGG